MQLSQYKGEEAIQVLADLIEPITEICADEKIANAYKSNATKLDLAKLILKNHSKSIIEILATLDGKKVEDYEVNILTLPKAILELLNDESLVSLFQSAGTD